MLLSCTVQAQTCYRVAESRAQALSGAPALPDYRAPLTARDPAHGRLAYREPAGEGLESGVFRLVITDARAGTRHVLEDIVNLSALAWSPEGERLAYCEGALLYTVAPHGGHRRALYAGPGGPYPGACLDLSWSPDGGRLSFTLIQNLFRPELAHPMRVTLALERCGPSAARGAPP